MKRCVLTSLLKHSFKYFGDADGWHEKFLLVFERPRKETGIRPIGKILKPAAGIDKIHTLSFSLSTVVSIPLRYPLIFFMSLTRIISILFSYCINSTFSPG